MNLCIVGWYYLENFYRMVEAARASYQATVVTRKKTNGWSISLPWSIAIPTVSCENVGLEWGAYNHYLRHVWDGEDPVLFLHDDIVLPGPEIFDTIAEVCAEWDVAFIFPDQEQARINGNAHGRMVYMSARLLERFEPIGFWYDRENRGNLDPPECNRGIQHFLSDLSWLIDRPGGEDLEVGCITVDGIDLGYRGKTGLAGAEYRLTHFK